MARFQHSNNKAFNITILGNTSLMLLPLLNQAKHTSTIKKKGEVKPTFISRAVDHEKTETE